MDLRVTAVWCAAPVYLLAGLVYGGIKGAMYGLLSGFDGLMRDVNRARRRRG